MNTQPGRVLLLAVLAALALVRCSWDAPRDNPLDPSLGGNLSGRVLTRRASPIAGARVSVPSAGRVTETDSDGHFDLQGLPVESLWVLFAADGHATESLRVGLTRGEVDTQTAYLNGLPFLVNCRVASHVYGRGWPPELLEFCTLTAGAGDLDGASDVDSVWVEIPDIGYARRLAYDADEKVFAQTIWDSDLPGRSLEALVGRDVHFFVADLESDTTAVTLAGIARIITELPEPVFPSGGADTLSSDTLIRWDRFDHGYAVSYHGEVVRMQGGSPAGLAAEFDTADTTWLFNSSALLSGDYYWTIEAIDEFGNSARSAEEVFFAR